jgi:release factor glutamine methyltransferase
LLARVLGQTRTSLVAHPGQPVDADQLARFQALAGRRAAREPFAYLVGEREFYGRTFQVDRRALIPRPESEQLIELALRASTHLPAEPLVIDVGTGSGCLAVTLAAELPGSFPVGSDRSAEALDLARANAERVGLERRIRFVRGDLLDWLGRRPDLVVANLPYVPSEAFPDLEAEVRDFEPRSALDGGPGGAGLIRRLLQQAAALGVRALLAELDPRQADALLAEARRLFPGLAVGLQSDLAGRARVLSLLARPA